MFIVIDGIDGAGKGTQLNLVKESLVDQGYSVLLLDYPRYGKESAYCVERYLNGDYGTDVSPKLASMFYAIDRFDSSFDFKALQKQYDFIISNRYVSASMIHQGGKIEDVEKREEFVAWLEDLEYNIFGIPKPDKTVFLNVSPEMSNKLVETKEKRDYIKSEQNKDLHESDDTHMSNAYTAAQEIAAKHPDWHKIDCEQNGKMRSREEITQEILQLIQH